MHSPLRPRCFICGLSMNTAGCNQLVPAASASTGPRQPPRSCYLIARTRALVKASHIVSIHTPPRRADL